MAGNVSALGQPLLFIVLCSDVFLLEISFDILYLLPHLLDQHFKLN
jgi:hypothetical protein